MLLTLSTTHTPATDLGFLLAKNPSRLQSFDLPFGQAHVFYPEATIDRCTAALLLDLDPIGLVRGWRGPAGEEGTLAQYVNDRPSRTRSPTSTRSRAPPRNRKPRSKRRSVSTTSAWVRSWLC